MYKITSDQIAELAKFLRPHIDLIEAEDYGTLYRYADRHDEAAVDYDHMIVHVLTDSLYKINVDPLKKLSYVPIYFAWGLPIESINLPDNIKAIDSVAFADCTHLQNIKWSSNLKRINSEAFKRCVSLDEVILPESLEILSDGVFLGAGLSKLTLGPNITDIGIDLFRGCENLKEITYRGTLDSWRRASASTEGAIGITPWMIFHCADGDFVWKNYKYSKI